MIIRGLVVKIKNPYCIVLAKDGTYHKAPLADSHGVTVGSEGEFTISTRFPRFPYLKQMALVASILIMVLCFTAYNMASGPQAMAYVSLDINPSVELEINSDFKITEIHSLNIDAAKIFSDTSLLGRDLYSSLNLVMTRALQHGYLKPGKKNYVLSTITMIDDTGNEMDYDSLAANFEKPIAGKNLDVEIVILSTEKKLRDEASKNGISTGKFLVYKDALQSGKTVTLNQVKENSLIQLQNKFEVKLLANNQKLIVKKVHISQGNEVKDPAARSEDVRGDHKNNSAKDQDKHGDKQQSTKKNQTEKITGNAGKNKNQPEANGNENKPLQEEQNKHEENSREESEENSQEENGLHEQNREETRQDNREEEQNNSKNIDQEPSEDYDRDDAQDSIDEDQDVTPGTSTGDSGKKSDSDTDSPDGSSENHQRKD